MGITNIAQAAAAAATNGLTAGLASTNYVNAATNGLASTNYVVAYVAANGGGGGSASNAVANFNGLGTNANFSGLTTLNASNVQVYAAVMGAAATIPTMTSSSTPSGLVTASSTNALYLPYNAFSGSLGGWQNTGFEEPAWLQYDFPSPVMIAGSTFTFSFNNGRTGSAKFQYAAAGGWVDAYASAAYTMGSPVVVTAAFPAVVSKSFRWVLTNDGTWFSSGGSNWGSSAFVQLKNVQVVSVPLNTNASTATNITGMNIIDSQNPLQINATNGLFLNGVLDAQGYTVGGLPLVTTNGLQVGDGAGTNAIAPAGGGSLFSQLVVSGCVDVASNYNGYYDSTGTGYYTNEVSGWCLAAPGILYGTNTFTYPRYVLTTNINSHNGSRAMYMVPAYTCPFLIGTWSGKGAGVYAGSPTNRPTVAWVTAPGITNGQSGVALSGTFTDTNGNALTTGQQYQNVTYLGVTNGADVTAALQALLAVPYAWYYFPPGTYTAQELWITNGVHLAIDGTLLYATNAQNTNIFLTTGTNSSIVITGNGKILGGNYTNGWFGNGRVRLGLDPVLGEVQGSEVRVAREHPPDRLCAHDPASASSQ